MITSNTINNLYNKFNNMSANADLVLDRNLNQLMMFALDSDHVDFEGDRLVFAQGRGPLDSIEIERICGAQDLGSHMAIITPATVLLVNKTTGALSVTLAE